MKIIKRGKISPCVCELCGTVFLPKWRNLKKSSRLAREVVDCPMCKKANYIKFDKEETDERR